MGLSKELSTQLAPFLKKYTVPIFALDWEPPSTIQGFVLTQKQASELQTLLPHYTFKLHIVEKNPPDSFVLGNAEVLSLYTTPTEKKLATQWEKTEPSLRNIWTWQGYTLVQKHEKTLGWVLDSEIVSTPYFPKHSSPSFSLPAFLDEIKRSLDIPYLLGGRSATAVDCSGLIQRALWKTSQYNYPRHSLDQMKKGVRKERGTELPGDLIFARSLQENTTKNILHVAVHIEKNTVIHACRQKGKVVKMSYTEFFERYAYAGTRAISKPALEGDAL